MNDRQRLQKALDALQTQGYETHARFWCCMSCGLAALKEETTDYVFWHEQDDAFAFGEANDNFRYRRPYRFIQIEGEDEETENEWKRHTTLLHPLHLRWGGDTDLIQQAFQAQGFTTHWDGDPGKTIEVLPRRATLTELKPA